MSVVDDIVESYRRPRAVIRRKLAAGLREDRALATLFGACVLIFVAQWPGHARAAYIDPSQPLDARLTGALLSTVFLLPIVAYAVAGLSHLVAGFLGGKGSYFSARYALFWSLFAVTPLMLLDGLTSGFLGPGTPSLVIKITVFGAFLYLWGSMMAEAETPEKGQGTHV